MNMILIHVGLTDVDQAIAIGAVGMVLAFFVGGLMGWRLGTSEKELKRYK